MTTQYSILGVSKLKSLGEIAAMSNHWLRTRPTPNSDPAKRKHNLTIHGARNPYKAFRALMEKKGITKFRKGGVLLIEFVLTFSPEFLIDESTGKKREDATELTREWARASRQWMVDRFGENCISIIYHGCEKTPHLHCAVAPLELKTRKSGKQVWTLNARGITGGPEKLRILHDINANAVKHLGLKRGVRGSKAKHTTLKAYYGAIIEAQRECNDLNVPAPSSNPKKLVGWNETMQKIIRALKSTQTHENDTLHRVVDELVETNQRLQSELENYQRNSRDYRHF